MVEWISASGERFTPTVRVIKEAQGSVFNDHWIIAEIDFRDYTTTIKAWPSIGGKWAHEVTPWKYSHSTIIAFHEWLHKRKEEAKQKGVEA